MTDEGAERPERGSKSSTGGDQRRAREAERLAEALRENLRRRKEQGRLRRRPPEAS